MNSLDGGDPQASMDLYVLFLVHTDVTRIRA